MMADKSKMADQCHTLQQQAATLTTQVSDTHTHTQLAEGSHTTQWSMELARSIIIVQSFIQNVL